MPKVNISPPLRGPTQGEAVIEVVGDSVGACLDAVEERHPGFKALVLGADGAPHGFLKIFLNGEPITSLDDTVTESDEIEVLAAVGGG
ncbi:MAG: MoaD/ThiS family protein [Deltaproteobacteria bacterium]|nr:MoaD/ThiS family protein [Deltaproteobacteria bacterium]